MIKGRDGRRERVKSVTYLPATTMARESPCSQYVSSARVPFSAEAPISHEDIWMICEIAGRDHDREGDTYIFLISFHLFSWHQLGSKYNRANIDWRGTHRNPLRHQIHRPRPHLFPISDCRDARYTKEYASQPRYWTEWTEQSEPASQNNDCVVPLTIMEHAEGSGKGKVAHDVEAEEVEPCRRIDWFSSRGGNHSFELVGDIYHSGFVAS